MKGPNQAIVQLFDREAPVGKEVDLYSTTRQRSERLSLGTLTLPEGPSNLMFKLIGKNEESGGQGFDLITIQCDRVK